MPPSDFTRRLTINVFSEIGFLELTVKKFEEGLEQEAADWFLKFVQLNGFRKLPGKDKLTVLSNYFLDQLISGRYALIFKLRQTLKLNDRGLHDNVAEPYGLAAEYFQRKIKDRTPTREEALAAMRRIRPSLPLPKSLS